MKKTLRNLTLAIPLALSMGCNSQIRVPFNDYSYPTDTLKHIYKISENENKGRNYLEMTWNIREELGESAPRMDSNGDKIISKKEVDDYISSLSNVSFH